MKQMSISRLVTLLPLAVLLLVFSATRTHAATFTVNSTLDLSDLNPGDGFCAATVLGTCTLRGAIEEANAFAGTDTIAFAISGAGVKTIAPLTNYQAISEPLIIDGWTQGGVGYTGSPLIELDGVNSFTVVPPATILPNTILITAGNSTVRGLIIHNFTNGLELKTLGGNTIQGCYIGTDSSGTIDLGNSTGISITSPNNLIGGILPAHRNVISGNGTGIFINGNSATNNRVQGNYIGTNASGNADLGNTNDGVSIDLASFNTVGGTTAPERNVISGNGDGVQIRGATASENVVTGNYIGTDVSGTADLGNGRGVNILTNAFNNRIGGTGTGESNIIAYSTSGGIVIGDSLSRGNSLRRNSIFSNDNTGIDLIPQGLTLNDTDDPDTGANNLQNFPVLTEAVNLAPNTNIEGSLNSTPNTSFTIEFFSSPSCDSSGNGEGETYIGSTTVTTDAGGDIAFTYSPVILPLGRFITTTATRNVAPLDTSEFSECIQVTNPFPPLVLNTFDSGAGSLRQAILDANILVGLDTIRFNIPGGGVKTINLLSPLPTITEAVIIDGATQPGFSGLPLIELRGANAGAIADGLYITSGNSAVKHLLINRFNGDGIELATGGGNTITGCIIGTDLNDGLDIGNANGININGSANNRVGGANPLARNLISGNNANGILISGTAATGNDIVGNIIGPDITRSFILGNLENGIAVVGASNNNIGGATADLGNLISGNGMNGIRITNASGNQLKSNLIGTDGVGALALGNVLNGVLLDTGANGNTIGAEGGGNTIAFNPTGVFVVSAATGNRLRRNSIFSNDNAGIDLFPDGLTPNDTDDPDTGANNLQNFPVLTTVFNTTGGTTIQGSLNSTPNTAFTIEAFSNLSCDFSGNREGKTFIGSTTVTTDAGGDIAFSFAAGGQVPLGSFITTTATRNIAPLDTSEFSACVAVVAGPGNLTFSATTYPTGENAGSRTITVNRVDGSNGQITVNYATSNGTATAGQDYTATSGTLIFNNGETAKTFAVSITNDTLDETDETVNLTLSNPSPNVLLTPNATAVLTILDNDAPPTISLTDVALEEGNIGSSQFTFTAQLSSASSLPVSVDYATANGAATLNQDYLPATGQLNFAAGETVKTIAVTVLGDLTVELNETFFVNLANPANATFGDNQGLGTIIDDDNPGKFSFSFAPYTGVENTSVLVTVARTNGDAGTVSVDFSTSGGSATPFVDYTPAAGTLIFGDGETTRTFMVELLDDALVEPTENFNVVLSNPIGGASLGAPSVASVNILDNDSGTLYAISGEILQTNAAPLIGATVNLTGAQNGATTTDNLGRYSFVNLAPNATYAVTPAALGFTFNPINRQYNNLSANITNANFTATAAPVRQLRIIGGNATPTQNITAIVELVAQGDENSVGFSMNFNQTILLNPLVALNTDAAAASLIINDTQAGTGKLGIILALPAGQSFTAGAKSLVTVTFNTAATNLYSSPVTFGDAPTVREVANTNADPLPTTYLDGAVTFAQGWEADVAPRPTGNNNGTITVSDFTQVGRFAAGLDTNYQLNEFQRADCAPRVSLGNGLVTVSDYTQAGRYAANLDAATPTGGSTGNRREESGKSLVHPSSFILHPSNAPTAVRVVNAQAAPNTQVVVSLEADAQGGENGFGFTLDYDTTKLSNPLVALGAGVPSNAALIPNTTQTGKVGVILGLPFGVGLTAGTKQLVTIRFDVVSNAAAGDSALTFSDAPVFREVSDVNANVLPSTSQNGAVTILFPTAASVSLGGYVLTQLGRAPRGAFVTLTDLLGNSRETTVNRFGYYQFTEVEAGRVYFLTVTAKGYNFTPPNAVVTPNFDIAELNFTAFAVRQD